MIQEQIFIELTQHWVDCMHNKAARCKRMEEFFLIGLGREDNYRRFQPERQLQLEAVPKCLKAGADVLIEPESRGTGNGTG